MGPISLSFCHEIFMPKLSSYLIYKYGFIIKASSF
jgi:hypothetical protein